MKRLLVVIPVAVIVVLALFWSQSRTGPFFVSGFVESHQIRVGSRVGGRVEKVHVVEGQAVKQNDVLLELEPYDLHELLAEAESALQAREARLAKLAAGPRKEEIEGARAARSWAQATLDKAIAGPRPQEVRIAEDKLARAEAELLKAEKDHARIKRLFDSEQAADEEMDEAQRALSVAQANTAQARDEVDLLRAGTRAEEIAEARARLAESEQALALLEAGTREEEVTEAKAMVASARAAVVAIQRRIAELSVRAPLDSIVEAVDLRPGDLIAPNAPVIALSDPSELWVRAYVPENRLDIQLGHEVAVRVDSFPKRRFAGRISFISRVAEFTPSNVQTPEERSKQVFRIKVALEEGLGVLRAGMAADVFLESPE
jgi:multidrug resistance efflux pump